MKITVALQENDECPPVVGGELAGFSLSAALSFGSVIRAVSHRASALSIAFAVWLAMPGRKCEQVPRIRPMLA